MSTGIRHYDAATAPTGMLRHLRSLPGYPRRVWEHRFMVSNFFRRELLGRFRGSVLGIFWVLVQPIFLFTVYFLVFGMLFGNWRWGKPPDPAFALYLFSGMIAFQALVEGTSGCCTAVVSNANLVKKVAFPSELLTVPIAMVATTVYLVGVAVCLLAALIIAALTDGSLLQPGLSTLVLLPLVVLVQFVMIVGIGLVLATFQVFARDVSHLWRIIATAWMFLSPVFWYPAMIRDKFSELGIWVADLFFALNPAYSLLQANRLALGAVDLDTDRGTLEFGSFWHHLGLAALWAALFLVIGYSTFMSRRHKFADLV